MIPPKVSLSSAADEKEPLQAGFSCCPKLEIIKKRADFLRAARGPRVAMQGFVLQIRNRGDDGPMRVGFTCSKKVGNAVARNRAKRRLREIARLTLPDHGQTGTDYVLIGRREKTATLDFQRLRADLETALTRHPSPREKA